MSGPPPGYSESASMLPSTSGTIQAMHGGGSSDSPYTGGVTEMNSMIPDVKGSIANYSGGAANNAIPIAIASTVATTSAPPAPIQPSNADSAVEPIAVAVASAAPQSSSSMDLPVEILNSNPTAQVAIATVATLAKNTSNAVDNTNEEDKKKIITAALSAAAIKMKTNEEKEEEEEEEEQEEEEQEEEEQEEDGEKKESETKTMIVYGEKYNVPDPVTRPKNKEWLRLMKKLGLIVLSPTDQQEFKKMIYKDSTCLEQDLPISTSIECEAIRKFIFKVANLLLAKSFIPSNPTTTIAVETMENVSSSMGQSKKEEPPKEAPKEEPKEEPPKEEPPKEAPKEEPPKEEPPKEAPKEAPKEEPKEEVPKKEVSVAKGGLRGKKRRIIRKQK